MCELDSAATCHHHAQVSQRLGIPTAEYEATPALNQAQGLHCAGFWAAQVVYSVDLDAQGQVPVVTQVLDEGPAFDGVIWTWRYRLAPWHRLLHMDLNPQSVPRHWPAMDDPRYDR